MTTDAARGVQGLLTIRELADRMPDITHDALRGLCDRGTIRTVSFGAGTKRFIPADEVQRLRTLGFTVQSVQTQQSTPNSRASTNDETMNA